MNSRLTYLAGDAAYSNIRENGLSPDRVKAVIGASGAAKWLVLYGLDRAVFSEWLKAGKEKIYLLGASIGAWKMAAAAQDDPKKAFDRLSAAYIRQSYPGRITPEKIDIESRRIFRRFLPPGAVEGVLGHPRMRIAFLAVRCKGITASSNILLQSAGMLAAFAANLESRPRQGLFFERALFHDPRAGRRGFRLNGFGLHTINLTPDNFEQALMATGSIPLVMNGVRDIPGAPSR